MTLAGRSNLQVFNLFIQIIPFRVHAIDENFFLFPATAFYSFLLSYCFDDGIKPLVETSFLQLYLVVKLLG